MSKKKKKKDTIKRRTRAKKKGQSKSKSAYKPSRSNVQIISRPPVSDMDEPEGFRAVSMSHAMMEYVEPIMDFIEKGIVNDTNDALQLAIPIWNYGLSQDHTDSEKVKKDIIRNIEKKLKLSPQESEQFLESMIERKEYLFPSNIQPDNPMFMYMRKEKHFLIPEFNYKSLHILQQSFPPDEEDNKLMDLIDQMDYYIEKEKEYGTWEDQYFFMQEKCKDRFEKWLIDKDLKEYASDFVFSIETYLDFVYRYLHEDKITLKSVSPIYIEEFFVDYILRKVYTEPYEYIKYPPSLKCFYDFLYEKGYLENPNKIKKLLNEIEPHFIRILRDRFS